MTSKSKVRQAALNFIYASLQQPQEAPLDTDAFWDIALEKERERYHKSLAKALLHVGRGSADSHRLLVERATTFTDVSQGDMTTASLREELELYLNRNARLEASLPALALALNDKRADDTDNLNECCVEILRLAEVIEELAESIMRKFADFPAYRGKLEPLQAVMRRRCRLTAEMARFHKAEDLPATGEFKALVNNAQELLQVRPQAEALGASVLKEVERWDAIIEPLLVNYSLQRVDLVDKCIIYISLHELLDNKLAPAIVVSEATALANSYAGSKSAPFIHGVIGAASKHEA